MNAQTQQDGLVGSVTNWFAHPFNSSGNALTWVLFVGLFIIAAWGWNHVLMMINGDITG